MQQDLQQDIFYYSATGNSLAIAKRWIELMGGGRLLNLAHEPNLESCHQDIEQGAIQEKRSAVIVFPVFYWGVPLGVVRFVQEQDWSKYDTIYAVANFGGLPGLALEQMENLLQKQGARLNAGFLIQMPGNYIVNYGAFPKWFQQHLFRKMEKKLQKILDLLKHNVTRPIEKGVTWVDRLLSPRYYAKTAKFPTASSHFILLDTCNGCGICQNVCHFDNVSMDSGKPEWRQNCEQCMACIQLCPKQAIEFGNRTVGRKRYRHPEISLNELMFRGYVQQE